MKESDTAGIFFGKRCSVCGEPLLRVPRRRYCSRKCRSKMMEFIDFCCLGQSLELIFGLSQEELLGQYLRQRMGEALVRLPVSADVLGEVLIEIAEISDVVSTNIDEVIVRPTR